MRRSPLFEWVERMDVPLETAPEVDRWELPVSVSIQQMGGESVVVSEMEADHPTAAGRRVTRRYGAPVKGALERFLRLDGAADVRVADFVRKFGVLEFSNADFPENRRPGLRVRRSAQPVTEYRFYARLLLTTLRLAERERRSQPIHQEDSDFLMRWVAYRRSRYTGATDPWEGQDYAATLAAPMRAIAKRRPDAEKQLAAGVVSWWLHVGGVHPMLVWSGSDAPRIMWTGKLWGLIGSQLLYAVRREANSAACDNCGAVVERTRRPQANRRVWCDRVDCQRARAREAQRKRRAKAGA